MPDPRVSIRINPELWDKFGKYADLCHTSRAELLRDFIQKCLDSQDTTGYDQGDGKTTHPPKSDILYISLEAQIKMLQNQVGAMGERLTEVEAFLKAHQEIAPNPPKDQPAPPEPAPNLENSIIANLPDAPKDQDSPSHANSQEIGGNDPDLESLRKIVDGFLKARKNDGPFINWLFANHPDSKIAKGLAIKIGKQIPSKDRKELEPLIPKCFRPFAPCFLVIADENCNYRFWGGRNLEFDWKNARFWDRHSLACDAMKRLQKQAESVSYKAISIEEAIQWGIIDGF